MNAKALAGLAFCASLILIAGCGGSGSDDDGPPPAANPPPAGANAFGNAAALPPAIPQGFLVTPAAVSVTATSLAFSPDGGTLYVASLAGFVFAMPVIGGVIAGPPIPFLSGLSFPLGVLATDQGVFVSVAQDGEGAVIRAIDADGNLQPETVETVISGLPIGRHNTNGLALGPDGFIYVLNGNATDTGFRDEGGPPETPPFSGSLLRLDPAATDLAPDPAQVVATGWRNPFDLAFVPPGHPVLAPGLLAVTQNGPDGETYMQPDGSSIDRPDAEDTLSLFSVSEGVIEHFGFPWCLYDRDNGGLSGFTQDPAEGLCRPLPAAAFTGLSGPVSPTHPVTLFGKHVSANGLAFNPGGNFPAEFDGDLFVAEFGNNPGEDFVGHKIVRVRFGPGGEIAEVADFMSGITPLDLTFGPDGALWIADFSGVILRVSALPAP